MAAKLSSDKLSKWLERFRMAAIVKVRVGFLLLTALVIASTAAGQKVDENVARNESKVPRAGENGVTRPECIHCPEPQYNNEARKAKLSGTVLLDVTVTAEGDVLHVFVLKAPSETLAELAIAQVKKWKFKPALNAEGEPVTCRVYIQVNFHRDR
jgi:TonB family protein